MGLYQIEAPMEQSLATGRRPRRLSCEQLAAALEHLRGFKDLDHYWIEIHRLENEGDRLSRDAVASLFANGIDPMVVIRWKDIFAVSSGRSTPPRRRRTSSKASSSRTPERGRACQTAI